MLFNISQVSIPPSLMQLNCVHKSLECCSSHLDVHSVIFTELNIMFSYASSKPDMADRESQPPG
jgi:hypothetical protein